MARHLYLAVVLPTMLLSLSNAAPFRPGGSSGWIGSFPQPQDIQPQDIQPQDIQPQDIQPQDIQPQDLQPQDIQPQDVEPQQGMLPQELEELPNLHLQEIEAVPEFAPQDHEEPLGVQPQDIRLNEEEIAPHHHFKRHAEPQPWGGERPATLEQGQRGNPDLVANGAYTRLLRNMQPQEDDDALVPNEFSVGLLRNAHHRGEVDLVQNELSARLIPAEEVEGGFEADDEADRVVKQIGRFTVLKNLPGPARDSSLESDE